MHHVVVFFSILLVHVEPQTTKLRSFIFNILKISSLSGEPITDLVEELSI